MNYIIQKIKNKILKNRKKKLNQLLDIIENIEITDNSIIIKIDKNLVCYSEGHQLFVSNNDILIKSKNLHLNPNIQIENDVEEGKTNKVIKDVRYQNDKMLGIVDETLEHGKEIIKEEEENGCC